MKKPLQLCSGFFVSITIIMKKSAVLGLLLALVLPFTGYFLVKYYSEKTVQLPHRYFFDTIVQKENNGKVSMDTVWHKVRNLHFTNQLGKQVTLDDLQGKILVVDFFFCKCPTLCPGLAKSMARLQKSFKDNNDSIVQFISISIDPVHDSVPELRKFANRYTSNHDSWWFLTGNKEEIYDFALHELKASVADSEVDTAFIHTPNFFLLDRDRVVRGWYDGFDEKKQAALVKDIPLLMLEKNKKKTFGEVLKELFNGA